MLACKAHKVCKAYKAYKAYKEYEKSTHRYDGCRDYAATHRSSCSTLLAGMSHGASRGMSRGVGCCAVNELVSRALFIG